jgi:hypothetical protein
MCIHIVSRIIAFKNEGNSDTFYNTDESQKHCERSLKEKNKYCMVPLK